jgi:hypothetical protein
MFFPAPIVVERSVRLLHVLGVTGELLFIGIVAIPDQTSRKYCAVAKAAAEEAPMSAEVASLRR